MVPTAMKCAAGAGAWIVLLGFFFGCAGQVPPSGGPVDTVPPVILRTLPDTNAVRVEPKEITLEFSKYVDRRSVEESIFISPYVGELEFDWDGTEVTAKLGGGLRKNTTYVITVGTDVVDIRAGNRMASAFTLAFSTGDSIDRGYIRGRVFDEKPEGVMIFCYRLNALQPDTLNPARTKPDYITQTGKNGAFVLSHLAWGDYRVFGVRDEYRNLLYDKQIDQYAVAPEDFTLNSAHPERADVFLRLAKEDTTRPFLAGVKARDTYRISIRFSEPLDSAAFTAASIQVLDTLRRTTLPLRLVYLDRMDPSQAGVITRTPLDSSAVYRLRVWGVADLSGNRIDSTASGEVFEGTSARDTLRPSISVRDMRDSVKGIAPASAVELLFSDPVVPFSVPRVVSLLDSTKTPIRFRAEWTGVASITVTPVDPLQSKAWYTLRVTMDSVRSVLGRGYRDSTYVLRFQTLDLRTTGSIAGRVADPMGGRGKGSVLVTASSIDLSPAYSKTTTIPGVGPFTMTQLPEGKYVISGFRDETGTGKYSFGLPSPYMPSERFTVYPDTVRVRARWGVEGIVLSFH